jgi:hypothetical protein
MSTTIWEEGFLEDRVALVKDGQQLGYVERVGGSWRVVRDGQVIAIRPDKISAQSALLRETVG